MKLEEISIHNFCSCHNVSLRLAGFNPIVGYNNSGKSNILRAIEWLLRKSVLSSHAFWDAAQAVEVEGVIANVNLAVLPANQQAQVQPFLDGDRLRFRRRQESPVATAAQIRLEVWNPVTAAWAVNPTGLDTALGKLFPDPIYIGAMENAADDVAKVAAKNTIGLLIKYVVQQIRTQNQAEFAVVQQALGQVVGLLNGPQRIGQISELEAAASQAVSDFFPGLNLHLNIQTPEFDDLLKGTTISIDEAAGGTRPFASFGHGAQRSVHMALIKLLATYAGAFGAGATVVLLIDEPELYLHPQAIEILRQSLKTLSEQGFQIVFSTHSALLVGPEDVLDTVVVTKDATGTHPRQKLSTVAQVIAENPHQASVLFAIQNATYILFSESILLVEGKTEKMLIPELYRVIKGASFGQNKGCVVEAGSSSSIGPMCQVLRAVGYNAKALVDLDYIFRIAPVEGFIDLNNADYQTCLAWLRANSTNLSFFLDAGGLPTKLGPMGQRSALNPAEVFERLALAHAREVKRLAMLMRPHQLWVWTRGAIEAHFGIEKNDTARIAFITEMKQTQAIGHAADAVSLTELANWM